MGRLKRVGGRVALLGAKDRAGQNRQADARRGSSRERGYDRAWDKASVAYRQEHPCCQYCEAGALGPRQVSATTRVDHLYPQRTYEQVFWVRHWWVASCNACDAAKQALERRGKADLDQLAVRMARPVLD